MRQIPSPADDPILQEVLQAYAFPAPVQSLERYGQGHINDTYCIRCHPENGAVRQYILQRLSSAAFPRPDKLMENFVGITTYLKKVVQAEGGDPKRETLSLVPTREGKPYYLDRNGKAWRITNFIENTDCHQSATAQLFEASARAFGRFQYMLRDYPAQTLHETIVKFHDTEDRFAKFEAALAADALGRAKDIPDDIRFALERKADCSVSAQAMRDGILPLRVTHNDAKLNNILFDRTTGEGICIIDLDTTMPGLSINDFGDSIRFGANHAKEDEKDLRKVEFDIGLYEVYVRGFLQGARGSLTPGELEYLPWGARLMTLECGIRFLTDYLEGDHYFHTDYPQQNLDRTRTQFKLVKDMEEQFAQMFQVVKKYAEAD